MNKVVSEDKNRCLVYYFLFIDIFLVLMEISFFRWISNFFMMSIFIKVGFKCSMCSV